MECNKEEAIRAKEIAEKKMETNNFEGARKIALRAKSLYPDLENISQLLSICDVHCSSQKRLMGSEKDWYDILQTEKLSDESTVKKQFRRLALVLHPDKNRFPGAEAAFKSINEAYAVLSDSTKKYLYDTKIRVSATNTPVNPSNQMTKSSQPNKKNSTQSNISNGSNTNSSLNQQKATQPTPSVQSDAFWTACPYCTTRYQYLRTYIRKSLGCPTCKKVFVAHEVVVPGSSTKTNSGQQLPPKFGSAQPGSASREKVTPTCGNYKTGVENDKGTASAKTGKVQREQTDSGGVKVEAGAAAAKGADNLKNKETTNNTSCKKEGGTSNAANVQAGDLKNKTKKRVRKVSTESLKTKGVENSKSKETTDNTSCEKEGGTSTAANVQAGDLGNKTGKRVRKESSESSDVWSNSDSEKPTVKGKVSIHSPWKSLRKRRHVSYKEDDNDNVIEQNSNSEDSNSVAENLQKKKVESDAKDEAKGESDNSKLRNGPDDTLEVDSDSDDDTISSDSDKPEIECPDPEFSNFESARDETNFEVNQLWACYDTSDNMPRFYAKVKKVFKSPFQLTITWLEYVPINESFEDWVDEELPTGCGSFKLGTTEKTNLRLSFSHQMHYEKGKKRGYLLVYPRKGEVWALFKDWDPSWSSDPENHRDNFKYEVVEVVSDFSVDVGVRVVYLNRVSGFVSLFQRVSQDETESFLVMPDEIYKFSHLVPSFKMTGFEREGVPVGSFELDPASIPLNPDDVCKPSGKGNVEDGETGPGDDSNQKTDEKSEN